VQVVFLSNPHEVNSMQLVLSQFIQPCLTSELTSLFISGSRDLGLYRVSGVLSDIQKLKKAFEKSELLLHCCITDIAIMNLYKSL